MSVKIRLAKTGKKNAPTYKVVATQERTKRNGKFLEILGYFNPALKTNGLNINSDGINAWVAKGAQVSDAVKSLLAGTYKYTKYNPRKQKEEAFSAE